MNAEIFGYYRPRGLAQAGLEIYRSRLKHRGLKKRIYKILVRHAQSYDVVRNNIKLRCHIHDNVTERHIVFGGTSDNTKEMAILLDRLRPGGTFVDVGANCGVFSLGAALRVGESGRVISIEPNPTMLKRLRFNISANDLKNIEVVDCAIGDSDGIAEMRVCAHEMGKSSLIGSPSGPRISVPVRQLKNVLEQHGVQRIDAMKLDIEGFEDRAIMPLLKTADRALLPGVILIEKVHAYLWKDGCVHHLKAAGYRVEWQSDSDLLMCL